MLPFEKRDGKIIASQPVSKLFEGLPDGFYELEINRKRDNRSTRQNSLFHAWLSQLERESHVGYAAEEWKDVFRSSFLTTKKRNKTDRRKWVTKQRSTASLSTVEFNEFLEKVRTAALTPNVGPVRLLYPDEISFEAWLKTFS